MQKKKIRVLIVDDSASVRQMLTSILNEDPDIEVMGAASDPFAAARVTRSAEKLLVRINRLEGKLKNKSRNREEASSSLLDSETQ